MNGSTSSVSARAIVAREPVQGKPDWKLEDVTLRQLESNELLIRIVATGVCHTDLLFALMPPEAGPYPKVLGHEGAGYVQEIGSKVQNATVGDAVLLSFQFCSTCKNCKQNHPAYCQKFEELNYSGDPEVFHVADGSKSSGSFFGQSSFSSFAIVKDSSTIKVTDLIKNEEELKLFAPLGCGFQTGVGTVDQLAAAGSQDTVVIMGLGGVGLTAVMAAKMKECAIVIGIDRVPERLKIAKMCGATHTINTSDSELDLEEVVKALTGGNGPTITVDTTGNVNLIRMGVDFTANRGQMILLGVAPMDASLDVPLVKFMQTGKQLRGSIEGDTAPSEVEEFQTAITEMHTGVAIKPVLIW
ncbi:Aryl-alcohol dehydrogenase [Lachnellula occidentalis]|uniref:Aryl-alcohol dehydrogenase n=1 Tax=Lachnellula occidentalis TaxID=215460 RepID=A0A8H8RWX7_9HELO|nr:Aryl-alcohol dehydrogenase [Lachnellula occidentalis]